MAKYRQLITVTTILGIVFIVLQIMGFYDLNNRGIKLIGQGSNAAGSFLFVIASLHMLHLVGGIVVLVVMFVKAFGGKSRNYSPVPIEMTATYWHFVDGLWIYLFVFLNMIQ